MKVLGVTGWKNSGKTRLVSSLVTWFVEKGYRVATIKHAHHEFDIDKAGTDSFNHRAAGAEQVIIASSRRWAKMHELRSESEPSLAFLLTQIETVDLVLVEGFKNDDHPKIVVFRPSVSSESIPQGLPQVIALASDEQIEPEEFGITCDLLDLNDIPAIGVFVMNHFGGMKQ